jgi:hypothetical protein
MNLALARQSSFPARLWIACLLTAAADFLLFDQVPGISLFIFVCLLAGAIVMVHPYRRSRKQALIPTSLLLIGFLPLIENVSGLSVSIAMFSLAAFALAVSGRLRDRFVLSVKQTLVFLLSVPIRLARDFLRWRVAVKRLGSSTIKLGIFAGWLMPLVLAAVFVGLFGLAKRADGKPRPIKCEGHGPPEGNSCGGGTGRSRHVHQLKSVGTNIHHAAPNFCAVQLCVRLQSLALAFSLGCAIHANATK